MQEFMAAAFTYGLFALAMAVSGWTLWDSFQSALAFCRAFDRPVEYPARRYEARNRRAAMRPMRPALRAAA